MGTRQLRAARLGVLAPPRRGTVFPDGQAEAFGAQGYDPGPWLHLADDLSVLRYKDLHRDPLGRPPEHTHGGHLPGQEERRGCEQARWGFPDSKHSYTLLVP